MNLKSASIFIITIACTLFVINNADNFSRIKYEKFFHSQYQLIPNHSEDELKEIPKPEHPHMGTFQNYFMSLDPDLGYVPSDRLHRAFIETREIQENIETRDVIWY
jgi:hypothetical protein